jgi:bacterioferritin-associated ferredoxin
VIICLCMGLTDEDLAGEVAGGCESFDDLIRIKLDDPKKACRECEEVVKSRMEIRRKISETT